MRTAIPCCVIALSMMGCMEQSGQSTQDAPAAKQPRSGPPLPPVLKQLKGSKPSGGSVEVAEKQPVAPPTERVKAEVGVAKKGRRLEDPRRIKMIVAPAVALFRTQERIVFEIQIPKAMQLYEALYGRKPKTHEEFLQQIVKANRIALPELPAGHRYIYDPQKGELMVEKPVR